MHTPAQIACNFWHCCFDIKRKTCVWIWVCAIILKCSLCPKQLPEIVRCFVFTIRFCRDKRRNDYQVASCRKYLVTLYFLFFFLSLRQQKCGSVFPFVWKICYRVTGGACMRAMKRSVRLQIWRVDVSVFKASVHCMKVEKRLSMNKYESPINSKFALNSNACFHPHIKF